MDESQDRWRSVQADNSDAQVLLDAALTKYQVWQSSSWWLLSGIGSQLGATSHCAVHECLSHLGCLAGCKPLPVHQPRQCPRPSHICRTQHKLTS